ncbi:MAG: type 2 isopentenyl-diphosphate Delta-isomerase [Bdellovibrionaceae bacterium]|nr:type 2 isopentenyl-diphosphate Delta-isomerase [Pseudobdellovibrionaceae bacterium]
MNERLEQFTQRKQDHIRLSLESRHQAEGLSELEKIELVHEALPEINFDEVQINQLRLGKEGRTPFLISSMTAGHSESFRLNAMLARAASDRGWLMGVGSQRRELTDNQAAEEWRRVRAHAIHAELLANIGMSQAIITPLDQLKKLVESLNAKALIIHTNPLQEALQLEGTPQFKGGLKTLEVLVKEMTVPIILKETGSGFSQKTIKQVRETGVSVVDISGLGGTHWGRIEASRAGTDSIQERAGATFAEWGISTLRSMIHAKEVKGEFEIWGSGGVRTGLDAAKLLAMGAKVVGFAQPVIKAAMEGEEALHQWMEQIEFELKVAMFCTGCQSLQKLNQKGVWVWKQK